MLFLSKKTRANGVAIVALLVAAVPGARVARAQGDGASVPMWWHETFESGALDFVDPSSKHDASALARVYGIAHDGSDRVLHAMHDGTSGSIPAMHYGKSFAKSPPPLERVSALRWRWRVLHQPSVGNDPWVDLAASVYVVMRVPGLLHGGRGFKLGWLAKPGPRDTSQHGLLQIPLREGGPLGEWHTESVDLCALFRRSFGACEGEHVLYVGVMTDADGTRSTSEAEYDDFELVATGP